MVWQPAEGGDAVSAEEWSLGEVATEDGESEESAPAGKALTGDAGPPGEVGGSAAAAASGGSGDGDAGEIEATEAPASAAEQEGAR